MDDHAVTTTCRRSGTAVVRGAELDRLVAAVTVPRAAEPATGPVDALLTVVGEAGAGKTTMVEAVVARFTADGGRILRADSSQSETHLAFSGLHQLLRPVRGRIDALPPRQRRALHVAFGLAERSEAPGPMLIGTAVLTMLSDLAAERPLLVVVDDAQWADRASLDALSFVARRLADEPVTLLIATRDPALRGLADQEPTLTLEPLDRGAAERLLDFQPRVPTGLTRASILDQAEGNPSPWWNWPGPPTAANARPARSTARFRSPNGWGGSTPTVWPHCPPRRAVRWCAWPPSTTRTRRALCCPGFPTSVIRCGRPPRRPDSSGEAGDDCAATTRSPAWRSTTWRPPRSGARRIWGWPGCSATRIPTGTRGILPPPHPD
ncbi:ATP-binding protein [Streptomyces albus]|nr:ATP-binding protein [Streptomyces albus]